eukprot:GGOE01008835.1.p3 GENE.GGOE01008835.1~~GGOE01008835.1.p3  ORF type:complete len:135 (-),score=4.50 GGOE01008835.1:275-679(-)
MQLSTQSLSPCCCRFRRSFPPGSSPGGCPQGCFHISRALEKRAWCLQGNFPMSSTQLPPNHFAILPFALCLLHPPPNARSTTSPAPQHGGSPHVWPAPRFLLNGTAHKKDGAILLLQSFKICVAGANVRLVLLR